jgi:hypothetical protein
MKNYKGIRKDNKCGTYQARKYLDGKEYTESFDKISDALKWRNNFHPDNITPIESVSPKRVRLNGVRISFL